VALGRPRLRRPLLVPLQGPLGRSRGPPDAPPATRPVAVRRGRELRRRRGRAAPGQVEGVAAFEQRVARAGDVRGKEEIDWGWEKDRRRRKEEEERKKKKKTHSLSTPVTSTFVGKKSKKLFSSGPVQRRPLRLQPPAACLPLGRGSGPGGPAADVWGRGAERGEGHFGASSSSSFFRKKFRFFCCCSKKNSLDLSLFVSLPLNSSSLSLPGPRSHREFAFFH